MTLKQIKKQAEAEFDKQPHGTIGEDSSIVIEFDEAKNLMLSQMDKVATQMAESIKLEEKDVMKEWSLSYGFNQAIQEQDRKITNFMKKDKE